MRLNWFAPPPGSEETCLLAAVAGRADVTVWTDRDGFPDAFGPTHRFQWPDVPWSEVNRADASVYHLGNDPDRFGGIWRVSRRQPGLVVLHDIGLHRLVHGTLKAVGDWPGYLALMARHHGRPGRAAARERWTGPGPADTLLDDFPMTAVAVEGALAVVVPTWPAFRQLRRAAMCLVAHAPWPGPGDEPHSPNEWADRLLTVAAAVPRLRAGRAARGLVDRIAVRWAADLGRSVSAGAGRRVAAAVDELLG